MEKGELMKKICLVAHLNDLSGANKSLVDLADFLRNTFKVVVIVPRNGLLNSELQSRGIETKVIYSGTWVFRKDESFIKKFIKRVLLKSSEKKFHTYLKKREV